MSGNSPDTSYFLPKLFVLYDVYFYILTFFCVKCSAIKEDKYYQLSERLHEEKKRN